MKTTIISILGTTLDNGFNPNRWQRWRPNVSLCMHDDLAVDELYLIHNKRAEPLYQQVKADIATVSPTTQVYSIPQEQNDPWDFAEVYGKLLAVCDNFDFDSDTQYFVHLTTGTHVAQICWFLLINNRFLPAKILQTAPPTKKQIDKKQAVKNQGDKPHDNQRFAGQYQIIDLDLSRYDELTASFLAKQQANVATLKTNIATQNPTYNQLIEQIEKVASRSTAPILLIGATGAGKSRLARQLYTIKRQQQQIGGEFIDINCATLRGDTASSMLFGHAKGSFTGAVSSREGLLKKADGGLLFLDEIGELGLDEQAMLLTALETGEFYPVGSDKPVNVSLQLMAGTNKDLRLAVQQGTFREDLFSRLNTWTFFLPSLKERIADLPANIDYELARLGNLAQVNYRFEPKALQCYLEFAKSEQAVWAGNFRDLTASMARLTTLADDFEISLNDVNEEIIRLQNLWAVHLSTASAQDNETEKTDDLLLSQYLSDKQINELDEFDKFQLIAVIKVCLQAKRQGKNQAEVGRYLFNHSREKLKNPNDSDRLRKFLLKFGLKYDDLVEG
ncbi:MULTISPECIES: RNA repair transcriptional activator RtcR [unclassified Moraxella]|uniref:RNA repair transcriptional activator RtcR n=1 Tax=unclassified Moraxella TaxID=2685852 RepID=UPI003AF52CF1